MMYVFLNKFSCIIMLWLWSTFW